LLLALLIELSELNEHEELSEQEIKRAELCEASVIILKFLEELKLGKSFRLVPTTSSFSYHSNSKNKEFINSSKKYEKREAIIYKD